MKPEHPKEIPGARKYSRVKLHMKQDYKPSITGYNYSTTVAQLEDHRALHPDAHMLLMKFKEEQHNTLKAIMKQLSLKAELK